MLQNEFYNPLKKSRKRVWRWDASWMWRTCWRWDKWQKARKSWSKWPLFEWWQTPLYKRLPKLRWFTNIFKKKYDVVNLSSLENLEWEISLEILSEKWIISWRTWNLKVLWVWEIKNKITLKAKKVSDSAKAKIEKAWWKVEILS